MALFFEQALLPQGWARGVRVLVDRGLIAAIETASEPVAKATSVTGSACQECRIFTPMLSSAACRASPK